MKDYIRELCKEVNINVIYTNNKQTVLSSGSRNGNPILRVHKIFRKCTKEVAEAVIDYYTNYSNRNSNLDTIHNYLNDNFYSKDYKIIAPNSIFKKIADEKIISKPLEKYKQTDLRELQIKKIIKDNFFGSESEIDPDEAIKSSSYDVVGLNIIVDYIERM